MTKVLGATSTTDDVLADISLRGKRILVTGVSAGLGVETARALVAHGAQVTGAARDLRKAEATTSGPVISPLSRPLRPLKMTPPLIEYNCGENSQDGQGRRCGHRSTT
jgi:hypothetical protein